MNELTIVIPAYNCEKYVEKCLKSLKAQSVKAFNVVIVDDGSDDNTLEVCQRYSDALSLTLIKNTNSQGPLKARLFGANNAQTEWVSFVDADDYVEIDYVETLLSNIHKNDADLFFFDYYIASKSKKSPSLWYEPVNTVSEKKDVIAYCEMSLCLLVTKKEYLNTMAVKDIRHGEDALVVHNLINNCEKTYIIQRPLYYYVWHDNSLSTKKDKNAYKDLRTSYYAIRELYDNNFAEEICFLGIKNLIYGSILNLYKSDENNKKIRMFEIVDEFTRLYPNWIKNPYIGKLSLYKKVFVWLCIKRRYSLVSLMTTVHSMILRMFYL